MRVAYGQSNVLRCSVTLAMIDLSQTLIILTQTKLLLDAFSLLNSKEQSRRNGLRDSLLYGNTVNQREI